MAITVKELRERLEQMPQNAEIRFEVPVYDWEMYPVKGGSQFDIADLHDTWFNNPDNKVVILTT